MSKQKLCTTCGHTGPSETITEGHFAIEVILWLMFIVPGIIYTLWRLTTRHEGCPKCHAKTIIPIDSPIAQKFLSGLGA
jgi:hypothetical protein